MYCIYYQARLVRKTIWFVVGVLRAENNVVFERACDDDAELFEFFVSPDQEQEFLVLMDSLMSRGYITSLERKPNRLQTQA